MGECFAGFLDGLDIEDGEGGFAFKKTLDLWKGFHFEGEEDGAVGDGSDMEAETEAWGFVAGMRIMHGDKLLIEFARPLVSPLYRKHCWVKTGSLRCE